MTATIRFVMSAGAASAILLSANGLSADHPLTARQQLAACMSKQMSASRVLSYNDAAKACKAQIKAQSATLASAPPAKFGTGLGR